MCDSMCKTGSKTKKIFYINLYLVKYAQLVEARGSIERSCLDREKNLDASLDG